MIKLKNSERDAVVHAVLKESFETRFDKLAKALESHAQELLLTEHPHYFELRKDPTILAYLKECDVVKFIIADSYAVQPKEYEKSHRLPRRRWDEGEYVKTLKPLNTIWSPNSREITIKSEELTKQYQDLWSDLTSARLKISAVLNSYIWREKFEVDFPQFAKYLPTAVRPAKLPAVIVNDVLKDLAVFGVPPKV